MSRIFETNYNKNIWNISCNSAKGYIFSKKDSSLTYSIKGNILGFEQVKCVEDTFLIYSRISWTKSKVARIKLMDGKIIEEYSHNFEKIDFISHDFILFDRNSSWSALLYSISMNHELVDLNFIEPMSQHSRDAMMCKSRNIELVYMEDASYPAYLKVEYTLFSEYIEAYIQLLVDPITLKPLSPAYSTLRGDYVPFNNEFTLTHIFKEDRANIIILEQELKKNFITENKRDDSELIQMLKIKQ